MKQSAMNEPNEYRTTSEKTVRQPNFELLRILCMLMVVSLHYLSKGGLLFSFQEDFTANTWIAYLLESFSVVAVNSFVLLTGFFMVNSVLKVRKVLGLLAQILFYTLGISCILLFIGAVPDYGFYQFVNDILPVQMEHYWFMTAYVLLLLFTPILNQALKSMSEKKLREVLFGLLLFFSIPKTILPVSVTIDQKGYDVVWFLIVYLIGAYIRLYGIKLFKDRKRSVTLYFGATILIFGRTLLYGFVFRMTGRFEDQVQEAFHYNHFLNLFAAIAFFYIFYYLKVKNKTIQKMILSLSPYVLGVYLLHEQLQVRYLWTSWFGVEKMAESPLFIPHYIGTLLLLFLVGVIVEWFRQMVFNFVGKTPFLRSLQR